MTTETETPTLSKAEAARRAWAHLGRMAATADVVQHCQDKYGVALTKASASQYRPREESPSYSRIASASDLEEQLLKVKELVARCGSLAELEAWIGRLREMTDTFGSLEEAEAAVATYKRIIEG